MRTDKRYTGTMAPGAVIALHTDPWLQDPETGEPVDLRPFEPLAPRTLGLDDCECLEWSIIPGVFAPCNDQFGIEAHDECNIFPGDLEAAEALAAHLSALTGRAFEVWYTEGTL